MVFCRLVRAELHKCPAAAALLDPSVSRVVRRKLLQPTPAEPHLGSTGGICGSAFDPGDGR